MFVVKLQLLKNHCHGNMIHFKHQGAYSLKGKSQGFFAIAL